MQLGINSIIAILIAVVIVTVFMAFFLGGTQQPIDERRIFAEGCISYCDDIKREASETQEPLEIVAVRKIQELEGSDFLKACSILYPETKDYPYLCWNRGCCLFQLRPP
ncbi:MAG: hypothetical protein HYW25_05225 [Candidatus Aenigmarchaeota archaeon]|nr:hypothetical protein [Candidatus Aenigmarchaeota archaeon]